MCFSIQREVFLKLIEAAVRVTNEIGHHPIFGHLLIKVKDDQVFVTGTGSRVKVKVGVITDNNADTVFTLPAKKTMTIVKSLDANSIITFNLKENFVFLSSGLSTFKLQTLNPDDFLAVTNSSALTEITIESDVLSQLLTSVSFAASKNSSNQPGCSLLSLEIKTDGTIRTVATDSHRLSIHEGDCSFKNKNEDAYTILLDAKVISGITGFLSHCDKVVKVHLFGDKASCLAAIKIINKDDSIIGRASYAIFPDYKKVIPDLIKEKPAILNKEDLISAVQRSMIVFDKKNKELTFKITKDEATITANSSDSDSSIESLSALSHNFIDFTIEASYISDALQHISDDNIELYQKNKTSPVILRSKGAFYPMHMIMPFRL